MSMGFQFCALDTGLVIAQKDAGNALMSPNRKIGFVVNTIDRFNRANGSEDTTQLGAHDVLIVVQGTPLPKRDVRRGRDCVFLG